jgi:hypothetical protein
LLPHAHQQAQQLHLLVKLHQLLGQVQPQKLRLAAAHSELSGKQRRTPPIGQGHQPQQLTVTQVAADLPQQGHQLAPHQGRQQLHEGQQLQHLRQPKQKQRPLQRAPIQTNQVGIHRLRKSGIKAKLLMVFNLTNLGAVGFLGP